MSTEQKSIGKVRAEGMNVATITPADGTLAERYVRLATRLNAIRDELEALWEESPFDSESRINLIAASDGLNDIHTRVINLAGYAALAKIHIHYRPAPNELTVMAERLYAFADRTPDLVPDSRTLCSLLRVAGDALEEAGEAADVRRKRAAMAEDHIVVEGRLKSTTCGMVG